MEDYSPITSTKTAPPSPAASIDDLPNETLHQIFLSCSGLSDLALNSTHPSNAIVACTHVCAAWRTFITSGESSCVLWTNVRFFIPNTGRNALRGPEGDKFDQRIYVVRDETYLAHPVVLSAKEQLRRTQGRLIDVEVCLREEADVHYLRSLWAAIEAAHSCWRTLTVTGIYWNTSFGRWLFEPRFHDTLTSKHDFPRLTHLKIALARGSSSSHNGNTRSEMQIWEEQIGVDVPRSYDDPDGWHNTLMDRVYGLRIACCSLPNPWSSPSLESVEIVSTPSGIPPLHKQMLASSTGYAQFCATDELFLSTLASLDPQDIVCPSSFTSLRHIKVSRIIDLHLAILLLSFRHCVEVLELGMDHETYIGNEFPQHYPQLHPGDERFVLQKLTRLRLLTSCVLLDDALQVVTAPLLTTLSVQRLTTRGEFDFVIGLVRRCNEARILMRGVVDAGAGIDVCVHGEIVDIEGAKTRLQEMGVTFRDSQWEKQMFGVERIVGPISHDEF